MDLNCCSRYLLKRSFILSSAEIISAYYAARKPDRRPCLRLYNAPARKRLHFFAKNFPFSAAGRTRCLSGTAGRRSGADFRAAAPRIAFASLFPCAMPCPDTSAPIPFSVYFPTCFFTVVLRRVLFRAERGPFPPSYVNKTNGRTKSYTSAEKIPDSMSVCRARTRSAVFSVRGGRDISCRAPGKSPSRARAP